MRSAWHITEGEGQMENTTIKRVLKTNPDGTQEAVIVENDLVKKDFRRNSYGTVEI